MIEHRDPFKTVPGGEGQCSAAAPAPCRRTSAATSSRESSVKGASAWGTWPTTTSCSAAWPSRCRIAEAAEACLTEARYMGSV